MYSARRLIYSLLVFCMALTFFSFKPAPHGTDKKKWVVVIDAGHGGKDPGCHGKKYKEKDVALAVSLKFGHYIEENNPDVQVIYTRKTDVFVALNERAEIANRNHADFFICIHCNASPNHDAAGAATYVMGLSKSEGNLEISKRENSSVLYEKDYKQTYNGFDPNSEEAAVLFAMYQNVYLQQSLDLSAKLETEYASRLKRTDNGVKQAGFLVLWKTAMPSLLTEIGFLTNPEEEKALGSQKGEDEIAKSIFLAFEQYKAEKDGSSYVPSSFNLKPLIVKNPSDSAESDSTEKVVSTPDTLKVKPKTVKTNDSIPKKQVVKAPEKKTIKHDSSDIKVQRMQDAIKNMQKDSAKTLVNKTAAKDSISEDSTRIVYRVQFAVSPTPLAKTDKRFENITDLWMYIESSTYKYTAGHYYTMKDAADLQNKLHNDGYKDAFVVTFRGSKRITLTKLSSK
jgi:N-acetylmuramoyl-L-alanine amidase